VVKLASNEYHEGPWPEVIEAIQQATTQVNRYPDPGCYKLSRAVASVVGVKPTELFFGNGNNEILEMLVHLFVGPGDKVVYAHPSFPIYRLICQSHFDCGVQVPTTKTYHPDFNAMADAITESTRIVFVCNPDNPTGTYVNAQAFASFLERVPSDVVVALDEAYLEFVTADDFPDFLALRQQYDNLVSLRSFSKAYSLAGLRVGYLIGSEEMVGLLHRVRQPFNVNRLAQAAAAAAIQLQDRVAQRRQETRMKLDQLEVELLRLDCRVFPSQTNFLLVQPPREIDDFFTRLLRLGVIVRPMAPFGLPNGSFRVNAGSEEENEIFLTALSDVLRNEDGA